MMPSLFYHFAFPLPQFSFPHICIYAQDILAALGPLDIWLFGCFDFLDM